MPAVHGGKPGSSQERALNTTEVGTSGNSHDRSSPEALAEVAHMALKLGFTAFGGPAAHIAMLREETVTRRRWLSDAYFLDLVGATNLIPGPNSTEMVIHVGYLRAGWRGLIVAGLLFILPAATMTLALAWAYVQYGSTLAGESLLYGVKPVIIAVVAQAIWGLGRTALTTPLLIALGVAAAALFLLGVNELVILFGGAVLVLAVRTGQGIISGTGRGGQPRCCQECWVSPRCRRWCRRRPCRSASRRSS